jgi:hypothetical protein
LNRLHQHGDRGFPAGASRLSASSGEPDEVLVADARAGLTPNDMVERKLVHLLNGVSVASSQLRMFGLRGRGRASD